MDNATSLTPPAEEDKKKEEKPKVREIFDYIDAAKKESIHTILQAAQLKTEGKKLFVTGCLVQQHGDEIFKELPEVDAFLGTGQLGQVADLLDNPRSRFIDRANPGGFMDPDLDAARQKVSPPVVWRADSPSLTRSLVHSLSRSPSAYLRLSEGCSHPCSFCVIPRLRGPVQSRSEETILREAHELAAQGVEEFSVIAQDTGDWGRDFAASSSPADSGGGSTGEMMGPRQGRSGATGKRLPSLLRSVSQIPGVRWIRLMYMHPASFTDELLDLLHG